MIFYRCQQASHIKMFTKGAPNQEPGYDAGVLFGIPRAGIGVTSAISIFVIFAHACFDQNKDGG